MRISDRYSFASFPDSTLPPIASGVYAIWVDDKILCCDQVGKRINELPQTRSQYGLMPAIGSYLRDSHSWNKPLKELANRFIIPALSTEDLKHFKSGNDNLDLAVNRFARQHLEYQYMLAEPNELETLLVLARCGEVFSQKPMIDSLPNETDLVAFLDVIREKGYSSPAGIYWNNFFKAIRKRALFGNEDEIPNPLVLGGAHASHRNKHEVFREHLIWAKQRGSLDHGFAYLKRILDEPEKWNVVGPEGWEYENRFWEDWDAEESSDFDD